MRLCLEALSLQALSLSFPMFLSLARNILSTAIVQVLSHLLFKVVHGKTEKELWSILLSKAESLPPPTSTADANKRVFYSGVFVQLDSLSGGQDKLSKLVERLTEFSNLHRVQPPAIVFYSTAKEARDSSAKFKAT